MATTSNLANKMYLEREKTGDVKFIVESEHIHAHRSVLAAISPKYEAQFYGSTPDDGDIHVNDISAAAFKEFIKFIYLEDATLTLGNIEDILNIAKQSLIEYIVTKCGRFLIKEVKENNLCWAYRLSIMYDIKTLRDSCEDRIISVTTKLFTTDDFMECDRDVLLHIVSLDEMPFDEIEIVDGCISWARAACRRKNLDDDKVQNLRAELNDIIFHIRFGSMTLIEFVTLHKSYEGFFSSDEFEEIICIISRYKGFKSQNFTQARRITDTNEIFSEDDSDDIRLEYSY